jgi:hypothetical protein
VFDGLAAGCGLPAILVVLAAHAGSQGRNAAVATLGGVAAAFEAHSPGVEFGGWALYMNDARQ